MPVWLEEVWRASAYKWTPHTSKMPLFASLLTCVAWSQTWDPLCPSEAMEVRKCRWQWGVTEVKACIPVMRCRAKHQCLSLVSVVSSFDDQNMDLEQGCESKEIKWVPKAVIDDSQLSPDVASSSVCFLWNTVNAVHPYLCTFAWKI